MKHYSAFLIAACSVLAAVGVSADPAPAPANTTSSAASVDAGASYTLMPDDVLSVTVVNCAQLNTQVVVTPDGNINLPLIHTVSVMGETPAQLSDKLTKLWTPYVVRPSVNVAVTQKHKQIVSVSGFVMRPGPDEYRGNMRVLDAISDAGGFTGDSDQTQVTVTHKNGEKQVLDLTNPGTKAGTDVDVPVYEGDSVFIPQATAKVSVVGQVHTPGSYAYKDPMKVLDVIGLAGGVIIEDADLKRATLTHDGVETPLDLDSLLKKGDLASNVKLAAGDRILIPEPVRCYVFGAVQRPGFYITKDGDRLLDAINACGGTSPEAALRNVRLVRIAKDKNTATSVPINLETFFKKGDMTMDPVIQPGDAIYVDLKGQNQTSNNIWGLLSGLNLLNTGAHILSAGLGH